MLEIIDDKKLLEMEDEEQREYFKKWDDYITQNIDEWNMSDDERELVRIIHRQMVLVE